MLNLILMVKGEMDQKARDARIYAGDITVVGARLVIIVNLNTDVPFAINLVTEHTYVVRQTM